MEQLTGLGWRIGVVWECALRGDQVPGAAARVAAWLKGDASTVEIPEAAPDCLPDV
jgi:G:T-mismatch repair DNA endonuclease (very short patch repair protein)